MAASKLTAYLKVYVTLLRYSFIQATAYRAAFLLQLIIELGYQVVFVVFFMVIFGNVPQIAGWSFYQMLFLTGLNIVATELIFSSAFILGLWKLPAAIKDGDIDVALLKPIHSLFNLSLSRPYLGGLAAALPGLGLMVYAATHLDGSLSLSGLAIGTVLFMSGLVIAYSIAVILSSLCFYFVNATALPKVASGILNNFTSYPPSAYQGALRGILFFVVPVVFVTGVPAEAMIRQVQPMMALLSPVMALVLLRLAIALWNRMITHYSSASS